MSEAKPEGKYKYLGNEPMWDWYSIDIKEEDGTKYVYFYSRIHVNRVVRMPVGYSTQFTDHEVLRDQHLITQVIDRYGLVWRKS